VTILIDGRALPNDVTFALAVVFGYLIIAGMLRVADDARAWWRARRQRMV